MKPQFTKLITLSLCLFFISKSIYAQGIKWSEGLNWEQIKAKAKTENKYIFIDCYATWCGPCKQMDKDVYPLEAVGHAMNDKFIAVKVQMDSTKNDTESTKQNYATARELEKKYSIAGFPTYLFFSADGEIVHKAMGFQKAEKFVQLINDVSLPEKQLYTQIKACREGKMDVNLIPSFIQRIKDGGDKVIAKELAREYMKTYMETLPETRFLTKGNLKLISDYQKMLHVNDRIYDLCSKKSKVIDSISGYPGYADMLTTNILWYDYVLPAIDLGKKNKNEPDWNKINTALINKGDSKRAEQILIDSKHYWYCTIKDWGKACDYEIIRFQRKDLKRLSEDQVCAELNTIAWTLFVYCFNKKQLEQGLAWINEAVALEERNHKPRADHMDTKANLLYKLDRKEEAIALQKKAVLLLESEMELKNNETELHVALSKMKLGKSTWPTSEIGVKDKKKVK